MHKSCGQNVVSENAGYSRVVSNTTTIIRTNLVVVMRCNTETLFNSPRELLLFRSVTRCFELKPSSIEINRDPLNTINA